MDTFTQVAPTHPGALLREDIIPAAGITVTALARSLRVSRQMLHGILAEQHGVTPEMALRLGTFFGNGPQLWLSMQNRYDLWLAATKLASVLPAIKQSALPPSAMKSPR